jgi:hypothetical protein
MITAALARPARSVPASRLTLTQPWALAGYLTIAGCSAGSHRRRRRGGRLVSALWPIWPARLQRQLRHSRLLPCCGE